MRPFMPLLLLVAWSTSAHAQFDARLRTGARVRLSSSHPEPILVVGRVASIDSDTIAVDRGVTESHLKLAVNDITALEVYRRGKSAEMSGMILGTLGAVSSGVIYVRWCLRNPEECSRIEPEDDDPYDDEEPTSFFATVTLGFGVIGYAIGYALVPPRWEVVNLPLRVGIAPLQRGVGVYVSLPAPRFDFVLGR